MSDNSGKQLRTLVLVSKTEIRSKEFSFSSRSLKMKIINLNLVSMSEIEGEFFSISSRSPRLSVKKFSSRLDVRDWIEEILILVSKLKTWLSLTSARFSPFFSVSLSLASLLSKADFHFEWRVRQPPPCVIAWLTFQMGPHCLSLSEHIPLVVTTNICVTMFLCRCNNKYLDIILLQPISSVTTVTSWNNTVTTSKCCNSIVTQNTL